MDKDKMAQRNKTYKENQMARLDQQGRHRSQWIYSPYDGRRDKEIPHGAGLEISKWDYITINSAWQSTK